MHCSAILFDLDGVLVDSAACVEETWRQWSRRHGLDPERIIGIAHGRRTAETIPIVAPHLNVADEIAALVAIESTTTDGVHAVPGAQALVESLPPDAWAVVTSGHRSVATLRIRHVGLPWPPVLVCADEAAVTLENHGVVDGQRFTMEGIEIWKVADDGRVCAVRAYFTPPEGVALDEYFTPDRDPSTD